MDYSQLIRERFSVLDYERRDVEPEKIHKIIAAALAAPTACNNQPQRILVINDDDKRAKLARACPGGRYVPAAFLICCRRDECWVRPMDGKSSGDIDAAIVATHMMLQCTDLGLGSIWVMYWDPEKMRTEFGLEDNIEPVALLITGYQLPEAKPRRGHLESKSGDDILL